MKDGGSAFPALNFIVPQDLADEGVRKLGETQGMTLRDYFAAKAMIIGYNHYPDGHEDGWEGLADMAYAYADAMLKARGK